jgi:Domain of unknown function (DUF4177)
MTTNWEYLVVKFDNVSAEDANVAALLGKYGAEGWELVQVTGPIGASGAIGNKFFFKRPKAAQAAAQSNFGR